MYLSKDQVEELRKLDEGEHAPWYPGSVVVKQEPSYYEESKYVSFHSMILRDYDDNLYRVYYHVTKEDDPELIEKSIVVKRVRVRTVTRNEYEDI